VNKDEGSEAKFKEINEAASVLGDDQKRQQYDQFGDAEAFKRSSGFSSSDFNFGDFASFDFGDIFDQFFSGGFTGRRRDARGGDIRADIEITLEEAAEGVVKTLSIPRIEKCATCSGTGAESEDDVKTCATCNGSGMMRRTQRTPFGMFATTSTCSECRGRGNVITKECKECDGTGLIRKTRKIEVKIPAGAEEGTNLRITNEGEFGERGGSPGDLYIIVHVKEHYTFLREGDDIHVKADLPFVIAALGGEIEVPTLEGKAKLKIPSGTQSNTVFRMKGKGIPYLHGYGKGDELVEVVITVPEKLTSKQKEILKEFDKSGKKKGWF